MSRGQAALVVGVVVEGVAVAEQVCENLEAAPDCTECPDVCSGNGGVPSNGSQSGSTSARMYVTGRSRLYRYLACQQAMNASATAMPTLAYVSAAAISDARSWRSTWVAIEIEWPGGVEVTPGSSDQNRAIASCSRVRLFTAS